MAIAIAEWVVRRMVLARRLATVASSKRGKASRRDNDALADVVKKSLMRLWEQAKAYGNVNA
jgi:hypothetical protein